MLTAASNMDRLLVRLERRVGRYAVPNLILYIVGGMAIVWALSFSRPESLGRLTLDMQAVRRGDVWRLATFLFIPPRSSPIWLLLNLYFTWWVGSSLEQHWGSFKFNLYYFVGALATVCAALIAGASSNIWLNSSLSLAFATTFPDVTILLLILPVRAKWIGILAAVLMIYAFAEGQWETRAAIIAAFGTYVLFFGGQWWQVWRQRGIAVRQTARREQLKSNAPVFGQRVCAICGAREADGTDIRVCSCEKCGRTPRALCLVHARNH